MKCLHSISLLSIVLVLLGANRLARALARELGAKGDEIVLIDDDQEDCKAAEADGLRVLHGSGLSEAVLRRADLESTGRGVALLAGAQAGVVPDLAAWERVAGEPEPSRFEPLISPEEGRRWLERY